MRDLDKALADIVAIRSQIAAGTAFRGYGPATMAATGAVALLTAILQFWLLDDPTSEPLGFFFGWFVAAGLSGAMIWIEMRARSRRHHSGLADAMIHQAVEQFLPAGVAGILLAVVMWKFAAETLWLLPGLWQILVSLGIFALCPLTAAQRRVRGRLVLHLGLCRGGAGEPHSHAVAMDHGAAFRDRPVGDGGHSVFRVRRQ